METKETSAKEGNKNKEIVEISEKVNEKSINEKEVKADSNDGQPLLYGLESYPPFGVTVLNGLQQIFINLGGPIATVYAINSVLCTGGNNLVFAELLSTTLFMMGLATLMQCVLGVRLPVVQGSSGAFLSTILAMKQDPKYQCTSSSANATTNGTSSTNTELWKDQINEISGALIIVSFVHIFVGASGLLTVLKKLFGPISMTVCISLIGLSLYQVPANAAKYSWGIAILTLILIYVFNLILAKVNVPVPFWTRQEKCHLAKLQLFQLFPHLMAISVTWLLSYILTVTNVFPNDPNDLSYRARTDAKLDALHRSSWFFFPYPFRTGLPTVSVAIVIGFMAAVVTSIVESIGDYYATAKVVGVPPPAAHAMNRGIFVEGIASLLSGMVGAGVATTSFSGTPGNIKMSGNGSRFAYAIIGLMFLVSGVIGKIGAVLSIIPDPIIGGMSIVGIGIVISIGLTNMVNVNVKSLRTLWIVGSSIMFALTMPYYIQTNPEAINTGNPSWDRAIRMLLGNSMLLGTVMACLLDNITPGTPEERGLENMQSYDEDNEFTRQTYDLPFISNRLRQIRCCFFVPFLPSFSTNACSCSCSCRKRKVQTRNQINVDDSETSTRV